jgi:hypothetical protein
VLAITIAIRLLSAVARALNQGRDVTDEELDQAMDRSEAATERLENLADRDLAGRDGDQAEGDGDA